MKRQKIDELRDVPEYACRSLLIPLSHKLSGVTKGAAYREVENAMQSMSKIEES